MFRPFVSLLLALLTLTAPASATEPAKHPGFEFTVGESKIKLYGFARLDLFYDDSKPNDPQTIQWIRSESESDSLTASVARENDAQFNMHPKLSRVGIDVATAGVSRLADAEVSGKIEIDFYNATASESREALRMRHGYGKLSWTKVSLLFGQTSDLISPLFPVVNSDVIMWNAGNLADRRPQLRLEFLPKAGDSRVALQAMAGQTGAVDNQSLDGGTGAANLDGVDAANMPTLQGRIAFFGKSWVAEKTLEIGAWGHFAVEELPDGAPRIGGERRWDSNAYGFDLKLPLHSRVTFEAEGWAGKNLDDVRGGIAQGINTRSGDPGFGKEIESMGGWAQLGILANDVVSLYGGASIDDPEDNLPTVGGRDLNQVFFFASRFALGGGFTVGLDYLNWTTEWTGLPDGTDNRVNLYGQFSF